MSVWTVVGAASDPDTYFCKHLVARIEKAEEGATSTFACMLEIDFMQLVQEKKVSSGGKYFTHKELYAVERNGELVGDLMALIDIADRFGFSDQSHFTREFRRHFGETPKAYRQSHTNCS